jgi:hypothetical protein
MYFRIRLILILAETVIPFKKILALKWFEAKTGVAGK